MGEMLAPWIADKRCLTSSECVSGSEVEIASYFQVGDM